MQVVRNLGMWIQAWLLVYVCFQGVERRGARPHSSCVLKVYFDRQHNRVVKNMGTEARLPCCPVS